MKCDDFLGHLATGGPLRRWLARRHAARCPRCAAASRGYQRMQEELARTTPLAPFERRLWEQAAPTASELEPGWHWTRPRLALAAAAVAVVVATGVVVMLRQGSDGLDRQIADDLKPPAKAEVPGAPLYTPVELVEMEQGLDQLSSDLDRLAEMAALLDARAAVGSLAAAYPAIKTANEASGGI